MIGLPPLANQTVTIERPVTIQDHGSTVPDWSQPPAESVVVTGCSAQPAGGSEDRLHRDQVGAQFTLFAPSSTVIGGLDRVWVTGYPNPLRIAAEPARWTPGFLNHTEFALVAWEG
jgi:hypothetical protein